ncbi:hypothetical protein [Lentzea sp. E54]|uniref:hypothetical protein n=1 Tax=Lentzea xerophila TaxID=3435883 RepID=UPI003DA29520
MSVTVSTLDVGNPTRPKDISHSGGEVIKVEEGHLFVLGDYPDNRTSRRVVAIYVSWFSAEAASGS